MTHRYVFHLSIPVVDLESSKRFYLDVLGAEVGRESKEWLDILLWGHQITLQHRPLDVAPLDRQGKRHFGVVLPWGEWDDEVTRLRAARVRFFVEPEILLHGTSDEQGKFYLADPSNNVIEIKTYRNPELTLRLPL